MKYLSTILLLILLFSCHKETEVSREQTFRKGGIKGRPVKPVDTVVVPVDTVVVTPPDTTADTVILPFSYSLWMPPVMNQGSEGACHSFSSVFARASEYYYSTGKQTAFSPSYLFNQIASANCVSSTLLGNLNLLKEKGVCTLSSFPFTWLDGCSLQPDSLQNAEALNYRIKGYTEIKAADIVGLKKALFENHALVIQIVPDQQFLDAKEGFVWRTFSGAMGSHGVAVCGYDDSVKAFKIINSFGTSWGSSGYGWISYDLFPQVSSSAFKMIL
jgi:C1A family cysteine protease